jgi:hypothetical protein
MRSPRFRVRLRFTVWRLLAAIACFGLVLGMIHDAAYTKDEEIPRSLVVGMAILYLLLAAIIAVPMLKLVLVLAKHTMGRLGLRRGGEGERMPG